MGCRITTHFHLPVTFLAGWGPLKRVSCRSDNFWSTNSCDYWQCDYFLLFGFYLESYSIWWTWGIQWQEVQWISVKFRFPHALCLCPSKMLVFLNWSRVGILCLDALIPGTRFPSWDQLAVAWAKPGSLLQVGEDRQCCSATVCVNWRADWTPNFPFNVSIYTFNFGKQGSVRWEEGQWWWLMISVPHADTTDIPQCCESA